MAGDNFDALRKALEAGPTSAWMTHPRDDNRWRENTAFAQSCEPDTIRALLAERDALQAKVEAMEKDAGRYAWLKAGARTRQGEVIPDTGTRLIDKNERQALMSFNYWCSPAELDAAIDAARAALAQPTGEKP